MAESPEPMIWVHERVSPGDVATRGLTHVLEYCRTPYQQVILGETIAYGRALVLDGHVQSMEAEEFIYHEPLVHLAMLQAAVTAPPRRVLVLGGGEGACLREALRWKSVERVVMVDLDADVVRMCKAHLPTYHEGAFDDPRVKLLHEDAWDYVRDSRETFDAVIHDLADPVEGSPAAKLFTREYFAMCRDRMSSHGGFCMQAGPLSPPFFGYHARVHRTAAEVWPTVSTVSTWVGGFGVPWAFLFAANGPMALNDPARLDEILAEQTTGGLRMINGATAWASVQMPPWVIEAERNAGPAFTMETLPQFGEGGFVLNS